MIDYNQRVERFRKVRKSKILQRALYAYRKIRWWRFPELKRNTIEKVIENYYGNIDNHTKKHIYKDLKNTCYEYGSIHPAFLENYFKFSFFSLTKRERMKYSVQTPLSLQYVWGYFNDMESSKLFNDKFEFYNHFKEFFHRDVFLADRTSDYNEFFKFCEVHKEVFIKPRNGMFGVGAKKYDVNTKDEINMLWEEVLSSEEGYIVEELIHAEESLKEYHPNSINALRVVTLVTEDDPEVLCAYVRLGNGGQSVEHIYTGALGASIDLSSGVVCTQGVDAYNRLYTFHPYSHKQIVGYQFKNWDQCIALVKEMALVIPNVRFVGWDVVINDKGEWIVVEGNHNGTFEIAQITLHRGLQETLDEVIDKEEKRK